MSFNEAASQRGGIQFDIEHGDGHKRASMRPPPKEAEYPHAEAHVGPRLGASMRPPPKEAEYVLEDEKTFWNTRLQ